MLGAEVAKVVLDGELSDRIGRNRKRLIRLRIFVLSLRTVDRTPGRCEVEVFDTSLDAGFEQFNGLCDISSDVESRIALGRRGVRTVSDAPEGRTDGGDQPRRRVY